MPLSRLFESAIGLARDGVPVSGTLHANATAKRAELEPAPGFADTFLPDGGVPEKDTTFCQPKLAATLEHLASAGLDDFYRGDLARSLSKELEALGSPLRLADLETYRALRVDPLSVELADARVYNMPPPTQGSRLS